MSKFIEQKKNMVSELTNMFQNHDSFIIFEFCTLSCEYLTNLKKELRKLDSKVLVRKNNIINRALQKSNLQQDIVLSGPNAILFGQQNINSIQMIAKASKEITEVKLKLAYFDKNILTGERLQDIVNLKTKDEMLSTFASLLLQPLYKLIFILGNIKNE